MDWPLVSTLIISCRAHIPVAFLRVRFFHDTDGASNAKSAWAFHKTECGEIPMRMCWLSHLWSGGGRHHDDLDPVFKLEDLVYKSCARQAELRPDGELMTVGDLSEKLAMCSSYSDITKAQRVNEILRVLHEYFFVCIICIFAKLLSNKQYLSWMSKPSDYYMKVGYLFNKAKLVQLGFWLKNRVNNSYSQHFFLMLKKVFLFHSIQLNFSQNISRLNSFRVIRYRSKILSA